MPVETFFVPESELHRSYKYRKLSGISESQEFKEDLSSVVKTHNKMIGLVSDSQTIVWSAQCPSHPILAKEVGISNILSPTTSTFDIRPRIKVSDSGVCVYISGINDRDIQTMSDFFHLNLKDMMSFLSVAIFSQGWKEIYKGEFGNFKIT